MFGLTASGFFVLLLEVGGGLLSGAAFGSSNARRVASGALVALVVALPFFVPATDAVSRSFVALGGMLAVMRFVEATRTQVVLPVPRAFVFILPVDLAHLHRAPPRLATESLARAAIHAAVMGAGLLCISVRALLGPSALVAAWFGGVLVLYGAVEVAGSTLRASLAAIGLSSAPMQRDPVLSMSVTEFWGERWNRVVGAWLRRHCFLPVARRAGPALGIVAAFAWSALVHAWAVLLGVGPSSALAMAAFFAIEGLVVLAETRLAVRAWPRPLARLWTVALVLGPSPLFVLPVLEIFGVQFDGSAL